MKILYFIRALVISFEFLLILTSLYFYQELKTISNQYKLDFLDKGDFTQWLYLLPITLGLYNIKSIKTSNYLKIDESKKIIKWKNYWKLKFHLIIGFMYALIFITTSLLSIVFFGKIEKFDSAYIFIIGLVGQCFLYISIHLSEDKIFEIINTEKQSVSNH